MLLYAMGECVSTTYAIATHTPYVTYSPRTEV